MGRTIPSFRWALSQEQASWSNFRKKLTKDDKQLLDELFDSARLFCSASSAATRLLRFEGFLMAVLFHHYKLLQELSATLESIRLSMGEADDSCRR